MKSSKQYNITDKTIIFDFVETVLRLASPSTNLYNFLDQMTSYTKIKWLQNQCVHLIEMSSSIMPTPDICAAQPVDSEVLQRLLQAARRGNVAGVRDAFSGGVPPDSLLTQGGRTALHVSAHHGFVQVALTIIGFGASVNAASKVFLSKCLFFTSPIWSN